MAYGFKDIGSQLLVLEEGGLREQSYLGALGLVHHPFPVAPDNEYFYMSSHIEQVIAELVHGILARKGFMVLSGEVGLGKTTITRRILQILCKQEVDTALVFNTSLSNLDLLREINRDFGLLSPAMRTAGAGLGDELHKLYTFLMTQYAHGRNCAIVIDDAQNLDRASLELVRMISNLEADRHKLVQILLVGQPELAAHLDTRELRQLRSRIVINKTVSPLNRHELREYVLFKLHQLEVDQDLTLTPDALRHLFRFSQGNFRQINLLMDRCLYAICRDRSRTIDGSIVLEAYRDLYPGRRARHKKGWPLIAGATVLALCLGMAAILPQLQIRHGTAAAPAIVTYKIPQPMQPTGDSGPPSHPDSARAGTAAPSDHVSVLDPAVINFLHPHGLDAQVADFELARQQGRLKQWAERVYLQSGYQLLQLPFLPDWIRRRYGSLALPSAAGGHQWLVFWKPRVHVEKFYYGYQGEEINQLQHLLYQRRLYNDACDGIVGARLMKAVVDFQVGSGLPVTGYPDAETLFLLYQPQEELS